MSSKLQSETNSSWRYRREKYLQFGEENCAKNLEGDIRGRMTAGKRKAGEYDVLPLSSGKWRKPIGEKEKTLK